MRRHLLAALLACSALVLTAYAGLQNDIPSCYAANNVGAAAPAPARELFVLIDQTTQLDPRLQSSVKENVLRFIRPGTAYVIGDFSAFSQGRYMEIISAGTLEQPVADSARNSIGVKVLRTFDACMQGQAGYGQKLIQSALDKALGGSTSTLSRSDVLASIKELSVRVRQSTAHDKVVFLVSDMLENSSVSSFYAAKNVRNIDPAKELKAAEAAGMIGNFGGARVFVLGAGIVPEDAAKGASGVYRDPKAMNALKEFWRQLLARSNAELVEFGTPAMMTPLQ